MVNQVLPVPIAGSGELAGTHEFATIAHMPVSLKLVKPEQRHNSDNFGLHFE